MLSYLLYTQEGKDFLLLKDGKIHAPLDWQAFSIMRASAGILLSSGPLIRNEKDLYQTRESYGDPHVKALNESLLGTKRQELAVLTRKMTY